MRVFPDYNPMNFTEIIEIIDFYLDINYYDEVDNIIELVFNKEKQIYASNTTVYWSRKTNFICDREKPQETILKIKKHMERNIKS